MKNKCFRVAEQLLLLSLPDDFQWKETLPSFVPFTCCCLLEETPMCSLQVVTEPLHPDFSSGVILAELPQVFGDRLRLIQVDEGYVIDLRLTAGGEWYRMVCNHRFTSAYAYVGTSGGYSGEVLKSFLMVLFAQAAVLHHTYLIHASVVVKDGKAYAFLGKSGTGKSTHSSLWMRFLEGVELLNDDNPVIRAVPGRQVRIYGTPWSGKTPCYKNQGAELAACVRLEQAPANSFRWQTGKDALISLLPSCSSMQWDGQLFTTLCNLLENTIRHVPMGHLRCRPDESAVKLCYDEILKI